MADTHTNTIFLYETNMIAREKLLNYFSRQGVRVLCLDFLVQVVKRVIDIEPVAILCNPGNNHDKVYENLLQIRRFGLLRKVPFMVYAMDHGHPWVDRFLDAGVHNIFHLKVPLTELHEKVMSLEKFNRKVKQSELIKEERKCPDGHFYKLYLPKPTDQNVFSTYMRSIIEEEVMPYWGNVVLQLSFLEQINKTNASLILEYNYKLNKEGMELVICAPPVEFENVIRRTGLSVFTSLADFESVHLPQQAELEASTSDVFDLLNGLPD